MSTRRLVLRVLALVRQRRHDRDLDDEMAALVPAWRAARVNPVQVLQAEG